jgi:hypothetical protein
MTLGAELGPLERLAGTWEGDQGLDVAFGNVEGTMIETPFRERTTFNPFGPVDNGSQQLYGLDYRTAAWRAGEEDPFHTEVGYWLWDAADRQVMRGFVVPRGMVILALGTADAGDTTFTMTADCESGSNGVLSNRYLVGSAKCTAFEVTITLAEDGNTFSYDETTTIAHARVEQPLIHTDRNTLQRVG